MMPISGIIEALSGGLPQNYRCSTPKVNFRQGKSGRWMARSGACPLPFFSDFLVLCVELMFHHGPEERWSHDCNDLNLFKGFGDSCHFPPTSVVIFCGNFDSLKSVTRTSPYRGSLARNKRNRGACSQTGVVSTSTHTFTTRLHNVDRSHDSESLKLCLFRVRYM